MWQLGILTTRSHPLLPYLLGRLTKVDNLQITLIFDRKDFGDKDRQIFADRTRGAFKDTSAITHLKQHAWVDVENHNDASCITEIRSRGVDLLLNGGTPRRIARELLNAPRLGVLNVHPGILPKYRGASCCEWALYHGDPVGVSAHFMDEGLDSGPIVFTRELKITDGMDYSDVRVALYRLWIEISAEAVTKVFDQQLTPKCLPVQAPGEPFKPIPAELLNEVKRRLSRNPGI